MIVLYSVLASLLERWNYT